MAIADRLFEKCGDIVALQTRSDTAALAGGVTEAYTSFATALPAKVVEIGSMQQGAEQIEEGVTHIVTISEQSGADDAEYVLCTARAGTTVSERYRVQRMRLVGPVTNRFRMIFCEEIESGV